MKTTMGATGWGVLVASLVILGACDDTKATCEKMCDKMGECMSAKGQSGAKSQPGAEGAAEQQQTEVAKCKEACEQQKEPSDAEKEQLAKAKECLDEDCPAFFACIDKL